MIRVVIVDDDVLVRTGLRVILNSENDIDVVGEGEDGADVPQLVAGHRPDIVLMDVRMPRVDGIAATRHISERSGAPKVLVMTTFENDSYIYDALRAGASGFVLKRVGADQLVTAVRTLATTDSILFPESIRALALSHSSSRSPARHAPLETLTTREADVLLAMARGLNNAEIAAQLFVGTETVKTHVGSILAKLGARDRTQAVIAAYESGFIGTD